MGVSVPCVKDRLDIIHDRIAQAARSAGRDPGDVRLVAVSKTHPQAAVVAALAAGQMCFGENRVQEAAQKFPPLRARYPQMRLHLIGGLQTNKVREALGVADQIETLDRPALLEALATQIARLGCRPEVLVQVNTGDEPQKSGVPRAQADDFIRLCQDRLGAMIRGVMCIPPHHDDSASHFAWLAECAFRHSLPVVSMGMSGDFETAIAQGATQVRIGTAIFGVR